MADDKDAAEDEYDQREYLALQSKIEARRIARDIQASLDTLATLRAEQEDLSAKTEATLKAHVESDRKKDRNASVPTDEGKKPRANQSTGKVNTGEALTTSTTEASLRVEEREKSKPTKAGERKRADTVVESKKTMIKPKAKRPTVATEPSRKNMAKTTTHSSDDDTMTEVLGPALVAGALGRKIGDTRTATMMRGITECRVELLSTRQKAKLPLPAAPNNSAESNSVAETAGVYDGRLSLSATDLHVQLELPGEVIGSTAEATSSAALSGRATAEMVTTEPRRISLISVVRPSDDRQPGDEVVNFSDKDREPRSTEPNASSDDTLINSGGIAIPAVTSAEIADRSKDRTKTDKETQGGEETEREGNAAGTPEKWRILREIDAAEAMRERLAETNPDLTTVASFLDSVCGRTRAPKKTEISEITAAETIEPMATRKSEVGTMDQPSHNTILSSRAVSGYGKTARVDKYQGCGDVESDSDHEMTDIVVVGDTEMSEGETSHNESESQSSSSSTSCSSGRSRASCKRAAEDSLEREPRRAERRPFPGVTSRGEGGCRVYLPTRETAERAATDETAAGDAEAVTEVASSRFEASGMGERAKPISHVANRVHVPTETSAGEKSTTEIKADATTYPTIAYDAPFVVRNTVLNVPVRLLPTTSARAIANVN